jgi:hypothetical protein
MSNSLYYGEIVAKISGVLHQNPDHIMRINKFMSNDNYNGATLLTLCADAAKVFDKIEDLSQEHFIDWHNAVENYSLEILDYLLSGQKLNIIDITSLTTRSIKN